MDLRKTIVTEYLGHWPISTMCPLLAAQHSIDESKRSLTVDQKLLTAIAADHLLRPHAAICKDEF